MSSASIADLVAFNQNDIFSDRQIEAKQSIRLLTKWTTSPQWSGATTPINRIFGKLGLKIASDRLFGEIPSNIIIFSGCYIRIGHKPRL